MCLGRQSTAEVGTVGPRSLLGGRVPPRWVRQVLGPCWAAEYRRGGYGRSSVPAGRQSTAEVGTVGLRSLLGGRVPPRWVRKGVGPCWAAEYRRGGDGRASGRAGGKRPAGGARGGRSA